MNLLEYILIYDEQYNVFSWKENPEKRQLKFFQIALVIASIIIWLLTRRLLTGRTIARFKQYPWFVSIQTLMSYSFLSILLLIAVHLSSLAIFSSTYNVEVLSIFTPKGQLSKPIIHHITVQSWRHQGEETLVTSDWFAAQRLGKTGRIRISMGKDLMGNNRVLRVVLLDGF